MGATHKHRLPTTLGWVALFGLVTPSCLDIPAVDDPAVTFACESDGDCAAGYRCLAGACVEKNADTEAPTVVSVSPTAGATDVALDTPVTLTFSEPVSEASLTDAVVLSPAGSWTLDGASLTVTFGGGLQYATSYSVTIGSTATDLAGNPLGEAYVLSFSTAAEPDTTAPTVTGYLPDITQATTRIPLDGAIVVVFSEVLDPSTITGTSVQVLDGGTAISVDVIYSEATHSLTLTPAQPPTFAASTTYVLVVDGVKDVAGNALAPVVNQSFVTYGAPGTLDTRFGASGAFVDPSLTDETWGYGVALDPSGKTVVCGESPAGLQLWRLSAQGTLDPTFDTDGVAAVNVAIPSGMASAYDVLALADGSVVTTGLVLTLGGDSEWVTGAFTSTGSPAPGFATNGVLVVDAATVNDEGNALVADGSGGYFLAGLRNDLGGVLHVLGDGTLDPLFGTGGFAELSHQTYEPITVANGLTLDGAGHIVVGGGIGAVVNDLDAAIWRLNVTDGSHDSTFGVDYGTTYDGMDGYLHGGDPTADDRMNDVVVASDGSIFAVGTTLSAGFGSLMTVWKVLADGSGSNTTFGNLNGTMTDAGAYSDAKGEAVAMDASGKLVVVGTSQENTTNPRRMTLWRVLGGGGFDTEFGNNGRVVLDSAVQGGSEAVGFDVALTSADLIVATGASLDGGMNHMTVWRLYP